MSRYRHSLKPVAARHEIMRQLFTIAEKRDIKDEALSALSGYSASTLRKWRRGKTEPSITCVSDFAESLGLRLILEYKDMAP